MKSLRHFLDRIRPNFEEGGRLESLYPLYEAVDTFLFTPGEVTQGPCHVRDSLDLKRIMSTVVVALIPAIAMALWNTGYQANRVLAASPAAMEIAQAGWRGRVLDALGVGLDPESFLSNVLHGALYFLPVYLVCNLVGGFWEVLFSCVRRHEVNEGFLVTGFLFPLILPPTIPLWQVALGTSFGVVLGKEVFGGTGMNFLNPALTCRAFLYFAYANNMVGDKVWVAVDWSQVDGLSGATPLGAIAGAGTTGMAAITDPHTGLGISWWDAFLGTIPGSMGETSTLACLLGAAVLIVTGIGSWRIMVSVVAGALAMATLFWSMGSETNPVFAMNPLWHLVVGGFAFGTVFMATDPVSAAMTQTGQWFYGLLIGAMTILIRVVNPAFPEGIMLAILFGNVFAPAIDYGVVQLHIRRRLARHVP